MIIVYYKNKETGEYTQVHTVRQEATLAGLAQAIANFNEEHPGTTCGAVEVADDSLEAYLFGTRNLRAKMDREAVQDAIDALHNALDYVRALEG